jgi:hypothetical protein
VIPTLLPLALLSVSQAAPIEALQWDRRVLIVFAPARDDGHLARQRRLLGASADLLAQRDVHLVEVVGDSVAGAHEYAGRLRSRYGVANDRFGAVLIGKDGMVKLREQDVIAPETLATLIDAMPMRRAEIRR